MTAEDQLTAAAANGQTAQAEALLLAGVPVNGKNSFGRTALQVMMMGSTSVAKLLLTHGANPKVEDEHTQATPLHDAARGGFLETVRLLLEAGAEPRARDKADKLPVDVARESGHTDVVALLETL